jgi:hypothetical protein
MNRPISDALILLIIEDAAQQPQMQRAEAKQVYSVS